MVILIGDVDMGMGMWEWDVPGKHSVDCRYHFFMAAVVAFRSQVDGN